MLDALLARAHADENVVGVVHSGSRGRGVYVTELSDWDAFVVVREPRGDYPSQHGDRLELSELTLERLSDPPDWARPALLWLEPLLDKTGEVADALRAATTVDPATAAEPLDAYVNSYYRSAKNARVGLALAALLDAQESLPWFLAFAFALDGRVRPYNKWLEWELREHALSFPLDLAAGADRADGRRRRAAGALPGRGATRPRARARRDDRRLGARSRLATRLARRRARARA